MTWLIAHKAVDGCTTPDQAAKALARAALDGATAAEIDCRQLVDGTPVSSHSPTAPDGRWLVDAAAPAVLALDAVLPVLADLGLHLYLDVKALGPAGADRLGALLDDHPSVQTILATHRAELIPRLTALARPCSVLYSAVDEDPALLAADTGASYVHPCWERLPDPAAVLAGPHLDRARSAGAGVITWHEERPDQLRALLALGVAGICTDDPALLADLAG